MSRPLSVSFPETCVPHTPAPGAMTPEPAQDAAVHRGLHGRHASPVLVVALGHHALLVEVDQLEGAGRDACALQRLEILARRQHGLDVDDHQAAFMGQDAGQFGDGDAGLDGDLALARLGEGGLGRDLAYMPEFRARW